MNWFFKAVLNFIALVVFIVVITSVRFCLFDNFDKNVYGICASCSEFIETKVEAGILLAGLFIATVILGRSVSWDEREREREREREGGGGGLIDNYMCTITYSNL